MGFPELFEQFQYLLEDHQQVMELIADLGEKSGGEFIFDRKYLIDTTNEMQNLILHMVKGVNLISSNRYLELYSTIDRIFIPLETELRGRLNLSRDMPYVVSLKEATPDRPELIGGKANALSIIMQNLSLPVPPGFVITTRAWRRFLEDNHLEERIHGWLEAWAAGERDETETARQLQYGILAGVVPQEVAGEIRRQAEKGGGSWAVRSSAYGEDGEITFAGLHESLLNVPAKGLLEAFKQVLASLYSPEALVYRQAMRMLGEEAAMAVLVQETGRQPGERGGAHPGRERLGAGLPGDLRLLGSGAHRGGGQESGGPLRGGAGLSPPPAAPGDRPEGDPGPARGRRGRGGGAGGREAQEQASLSEETLQTLVRWALSLERYFKRPQEIEWALDEAGQCWLLQSRGLQISKATLPAGAGYLRNLRSLSHTHSKNRRGGPCRGGLRAGLPGAVG